MKTKRSKILACFLSVALVLLTTPVCLQFNTSTKSLELHANKAHAVVPAAAGAFLAEIAAASGLTVSEFIATVVGVTTIGSGLSMATSTGINFGNSAAHNLEALLDAADYPAWDSLSSESQEIWGTEENYNTAKFNALLDAFDLGTARDRFYGSYGGNFEWTENETERIEQLGRIGQTWISNGANSVQTLLDTLTPDYQNVLNDYLGTKSFVTVDGSKIAGWPASVPTNLTISLGNYCVIKAGPKSSKYYYSQYGSTDEVYMLPSFGSNRYWGVRMISKSGFYYGARTDSYSDPNYEDSLTPPTTSNSSGQYTYQGNTYYWGRVTSGYTIDDLANHISSNMVLNDVTGATNEDLEKAMLLMLFNDDTLEDLGPYAPDIVGYPVDISEEGDTNVYFPSTGIVPGDTWQNFQTQPETPPIIDGDTDLSEIIQLLQQFHFTVDYNLLVQDNPLRNAVKEIISILNKLSFYSTGQLKVHDEGVYDALGDIGLQLSAIQDAINRFFITSTTGDVIGDLDFPDLGEKSADLLETISTLAPFGAMALISEMVAILSQVGKISKPELTFEFDFFPGHDYEIGIDLSWLDDVKPVINIACIITLVLGLLGATARLVELEAAA